MLSSTLARAQTTVQGRVADGKDQSPLIGANVLLIHLPDSVKAGTAADAGGSFQFDNVAAGRYVLRVLFLGYPTHIQPVTVAGAPVQLGTLTMNAGVQLKSVVVTGQAAQSVQKGDTTEYNARAFKTNPDATAGDLVQKLPGVTVGTDGKVQAQGENVAQVLVDGKPFFGSDPDAVLKNMPADAIDKIEVFDQQSEQSKFSGFNDGNTTKTLNIKTKAEYRNGSFGRVIAGAGNSRYKASGNINDFHGDRRVSVLAQSNNVNEQNFGTEDLLGVVGNSNQGGGGRGGGGGGNANSFLVNQSGGITKTNAAGLNYSNTWNKKTDLTGSYFFNRADNTINSSTQRYYVDTAKTRYNQVANTGSVNINHRANFRVEHKIDSTNSVLFRPSFVYQLNNGSSDLAGRTSQNGVPKSDISSGYASHYKAVTTSNDLLLRHRFHRAGRTLSLDLTQGYTLKDGNATLNTSNTATPTSDLNQYSTLNQNSWNLNSNIAYTEPISKQNQLQVNYAIGYAPNNSNKRTYDFVDADQKYSHPDTALSNVFKNYYLNQSGGLNIRRNTTKYQASIGIAGQLSQLYSDAQFPVPGIRRYTFVNALPSAVLMYRFTKQKNLRVFYRTNTNPPSISQLQAVVNNSNPLQLTIGNPTLRQEFQHSGVVRFSSSKPENSSSFFALVGGTVTQHPISNRTTVSPSGGTVYPDGAGPVNLPAGGQLTQPVNLSNQYSLRSSASYGRPLPAIKTNLNLGVSGNFSQTPGYVNGILNYSRTPSAGASIALSSNISPNLDYTVSTQATESYVRNTSRVSLNSNYLSQVTRVRFAWIVGPGINIQTDLLHQYYRGLSAGYNQQYILWNASIGKKVLPGQRGEIKIYAFDLLGQNRSIQRNVSAAYYEDVQTTVLQRYLMLMFTYNIRSGNITKPTAPTDGPGGQDGSGRRRGMGGMDGPGGMGPPPGGGPPGGGMGGPPGGP